MPEGSEMNPRPLLRSASSDYLSTARQVKNRIGVTVHGSRFTVRRSPLASLPDCDDLFPIDPISFISPIHGAFPR